MPRKELADEHHIQLIDPFLASKATMQYYESITILLRSSSNAVISVEELFSWTRFLDSTSQREAKRRIQKLQKKFKRHMHVTSLSICCHYWEKHCRYYDKQSVRAFGRCV